MFNRIILSRKGFDSASGGGFSPFDPQTGKYILLPIPVDEKECAISNPLKYDDIRIRSNYLHDYPEINLKSLMRHIGKKATIKDNEHEKGKEYEHAHFDPWLGYCPWLEGQSNHTIGAFGQIGSAQAHLDKQEVGKGCLFLFFSRFKPINRENMIVPDISWDNIKEGLYFIYGWLKVKEVIQRYEDIDNQSPLLKHPHATQAYFDKEDRIVRKKNNTIYIADELLFEDYTIPGCGYFPELNEHLLLTAPNQKSQKNWIPSRWELPVLLYEKCCSALRNRKCGDGSRTDSCLVNTQGQWQEAIFEGTDHFDKWFSNLLNKSNVKCL